ncbi:MAG: DNA mismatch repair protein MutS [Phycisphaeraceae bacterium]|nr:DNA mismatch repair protein MutS [Phycisphaeraceae bacterium]
MATPTTSTAATGEKASTGKSLKKPAKPKQDTPAMRQYKHFKKQHPGCVLFFRMGDFYEMFYEDAVLAHKAMGITLTQRTEGVPMAGVPYHSVEGYLRKMIQAGHRVAICEQVEDAKEAKGVVKRDVTRVMTPGTLTDESLLEEGAENPLASIVYHHQEGSDGAQASIAWLELSTGSFSVATLDEEQAEEELARIAPSELLYCDTATGDAPLRIEHLKQQLGCSATGRPSWQFRIDEAAEALKQQYGVAQLSGFGFADDDPALTAAGAVLQYLGETQRSGEEASGTPKQLAHLRPPKRFARHEHLVIDPTSLRSLEIDRTLRTGSTDGALLGVFKGPSAPNTAMGKRLLRHWLCYPLSDRGGIEQRQGVVQAMVDDSRFRRELKEAIDPVQDIERIAARLAVGRATPRDLVALGRSAGQAKAVQDVLTDRPNQSAYHNRAAQLLAILEPLAETILGACIDQPPAHLREGGLIADGHDAELDEARSLQRDSHAWLAQYQARLAEEHDLPHIKVGYNKVFGYYIELSAANKDKAPDSWSRKQTLKNAERFITQDLKEFEGKVLSAESRAVAREQALFTALCEQGAGEMASLHGFAQLVAELDVLGAFAERSARANYVKPTIVDQPVLQIEAGRHPVLDELLGDSFVPNDLRLGSDDEAHTLALITGPNMAGKSTYIRQAALITLLAHTGCFVPADSAVVGLTDRIFTRVGANDELHAGQSTFMVEMTETANICHHATDRSLVILDEIGRGTSTLDGLSLAWAIAEHLAGNEKQAGPRTLFATHYHEITTLAERLPSVTNLSVTVREWQDEIVFLHRIAPGAADRSYGIHVAKIAGIPDAVITRANQLLADLAVKSASAKPQAAKAAAPPPQMSLFKEYLPHPVMEKLTSTDLNALSPIEAFDLLRQWQSEIVEEQES